MLCKSSSSNYCLPQHHLGRWSYINFITLFFMLCKSSSSNYCLPQHHLGRWSYFNFKLIFLIKEYGGGTRSRTEIHGFAIHCIAILPSRHCKLFAYFLLLPKRKNPAKCLVKTGFRLLNWSGKRDSNSRPRPWQGRALPAELFPRAFKQVAIVAMVAFLSSCNGLSG